MEGDTGKDTGEEKESDDTDTGQSGEEEKGVTCLLHQTTKSSDCSEDDQSHPIMHWADLSLRIAELEKQEQEQRERAKSGGGTDLMNVSEGRTEDWQAGLLRENWEDEQDLGRCRVSVISSRFHNHKNLQLCFINNSESDEEEDESGASKEGSTGADSHGYRPAGLKQEVRAALGALRDKLWAEQKEQEHLTSSITVTKRKCVEHCDLLTCSLQQLSSLRTSLHQDIQDLSSELVTHLLIRDQLRTKQDAMLMDVQDLT